MTVQRTSTPGLTPFSPEPSFSFVPMPPDLATRDAARRERMAGLRSQVDALLPAALRQRVTEAARLVAALNDELNQMIGALRALDAPQEPGSLSVADAAAAEIRRLALGRYLPDLRARLAAASVGLDAVLFEAQTTLHRLTEPARAAALRQAAAFDRQAEAMRAAAGESRWDADALASACTGWLLEESHGQ